MTAVNTYRTHVNTGTLIHNTRNSHNTSKDSIFRVTLGDYSDFSMVDSLLIDRVSKRSIMFPHICYSQLLDFSSFESQTNVD